MARSRDRQLRERILETAIQVFGEKGFHSTTIRDIAGSLGIAPGSVYTYFSNKEELFRSAVAEGWSGFLEEIQKIVTAPKRLGERFESILDYCFESLRSALPLLRGMLYEARQRRLLHENLHRLCLLLEGLIREGQRQGLVGAALSEAHLGLHIRIIVFGVLSSIALAQDEALEAEIASVKAAVKRLIYQRLGLEGQR